MYDRITAKFGVGKVREYSIGGELIVRPICVGPQLFTRVLRRCNMTNALVDCKGNVFHIWDTKMVYPYGFTVAHKVAW